ncbi:MAG: NnrU family protein [Betaproteobacteria bacterium]
MALLIIGLVLFLGAHSTRMLADSARSSLISRFGENAWKGLITVVSIAGFVLIVIGYGQARTYPLPLWTAPLWAYYLTIPLTLIAFVLITAAYVPGNSIKAKVGHPMVAGVKTWALTHLLANGNLADALLFGSFLIWAVASFVYSRKRDRANGTRYPAGTAARTGLTVAVGTVVWVIFMMVLHVRWIGVSPLGMVMAPSTPVTEPPAVVEPVAEGEAKAAAPLSEKNDEPSVAK